MLPKLKISAYLLKRLEKVKQQCSGCLFGVFYGEGTLLLMGFNVESTIGQLNYEHIQQKFPAEMDLCGLVKFGDCTDAEAHLNDILKDVDITDNPILLHCELGTLVGLKASIFMHGKLQEVPYEIMQADKLYNDFCFTRLKCGLSVYAEANLKSLCHEMHALRKDLSGGRLAFNIQPTKIFLTNAEARGAGTMDSVKRISNESPIGDILNAVNEALEQQSATAGDNNKENSKRNAVKSKGAAGDGLLNLVYGAVGCDYEIINIDVLRCKTRDKAVVDANASAHAAAYGLPAASMCMKKEESKFEIPLEVDAMAILCKTTKVARLYDILIESICRSLRLFEHSMSEQLKKEQGQLMVPRNYHFFPQEFGHFLSCCYLEGVPDDEASMLEKRKRLHRHFGLPTIRPYFRRNNRCVFLSEVAAGAPLLNTHMGIRASGVADGQQYLVAGNYYYYHYLQQDMPDKGWGCAYRSLQTLASWFLLQGYTSRAVPTHHEIQKYLVSIGDKQSSFVGSTQWIGSTEVSMCLQGFLNVDSKILHVSSGAELSSIGTDLAMHFQTQGTPIMIGGGVLAHTIVGIDYCAQTGQIKFLILDPHYTGADDLHTIQSKGWCGWKGMDFWEKKSYYNLCMPQRPILF